MIYCRKKRDAIEWGKGTNPYGPEVLRLLWGEAGQQEQGARASAWLLKLTGDPNRVVYLGRDWSKPDTLPKREFSFDSFTFPACEACNSHYAPFEGQVMGTVNRMLDKQPITSDELIALLDWLDKVRVGLWLELNVLNKNYWNVEPQFHITARIAARDRMVCIYEDDDAPLELGSRGSNHPSFM